MRSRPSTRSFLTALAGFRRPRFAWGLLVAGLALAAPSIGQTEDPGGSDPRLEFRKMVERTRELSGESIAAYQVGEWATFRARSEAALDLRPDHPTLLYNAAAACARAGDTNAALALIDRFARMGLSAPFAEDEDFVPLHEDRRWASVMARVEANGRPIEASRVAFTIGSPDLLPEGLAWDSATGDHFIGGVRGKEIWRIERDGRASRFRERGADGLGSVFGLAVDAPRRRLYVCTAWMAETPGVGEATLGSSGLLVYDLDRDRRVGAHWLAAEGARRILNDLAVAEDGTVFVSDNQTGRLYRLSPDEAANGDGGVSALVDLGVSPELLSPQGLAVSADGRSLYVADYALGIVEVDLGTGRALRMSPIAGTSLLGIDGLVRHGNELIAIQNGVRPQRVLKIRLVEGGHALGRVDVLEANHPSFDEPTLGVVVNGRLRYVANSGWPSLTEGGGVKEGYELRDPVILELPL